MMSDVTYYRVQRGKPWFRRKCQAEWPDCDFAQRGYTQIGVATMIAVRRAHPRLNAAYVRGKRIIRWLDGHDNGWYRQRYTARGRRR